MALRLEASVMIEDQERSFVIDSRTSGVDEDTIRKMARTMRNTPSHFTGIVLTETTTRVIPPEEY